MPVASYNRCMARAKHGSYIFQRPGSENWWVKLRSPTGRVEKSLHTVDRREAEILAGPLITAHKAALLAARPRVERVWQHKLEPGRKHAAPDGGEIIATDKELLHIGSNGQIVRTEPNGAEAFRLASDVPLTLRGIAEAFLNVDYEAFGGLPTRAAPIKKNGDDAILEVYLKEKNITGHFENEARATWALYRLLTNGKPLRDADRDDGRKLVAHYEAKGLRSATIRKKVAWLTAAVNFAISEVRSPRSSRNAKMRKPACRSVRPTYSFANAILASSARLTDCYCGCWRVPECGCPRHSRLTVKNQRKKVVAL